MADMPETLISKVSSLLNISQESALDYIKRKTIQKFLDKVSSPMLKAEEDSLMLETGSSEDTSSTGIEKSKAIKLYLQGKRVNQEVIFQKWFARIGDTAIANQIDRYIKGETKSRKDKNGYLAQAKITDLKMFIILFNLLLDEKLEIRD